MLRHLTEGYRDFHVMPDLPSVRYNWVFVISFDDKLSPKLDPPQLLSTTSDTLAQIAEACGFQSATDFCRSFKTTFKVTPNCWRHQMNKSKSFDQNSLIFSDLLYDDEAKSAPANGGVPPRADASSPADSFTGFFALSSEVCIVFLAPVWN